MIRQILLGKNNEKEEVVPVRVELTTLTLLASRSNQLSYGTSHLHSSDLFPFLSFSKYLKAKIFNENFFSTIFLWMCLTCQFSLSKFFECVWTCYSSNSIFSSPKIVLNSFLLGIWLLRIFCVNLRTRWFFIFLHTRGFNPFWIKYLEKNKKTRNNQLWIDYWGILLIPKSKKRRKWSQWGLNSRPWRY